ncbi:hypothetical protein Poly51_00160 [Rubripirellula tenax]|uniref:Uncharacterized protein n=1 Tax=Rubripirellula tenax TaxID=2528015 RepID=A0A5C6FJ64_9BACT|nr:hypothetical protein [Rubripirellula tenax]TWU59744.1 hypothetical protein Poly51_00160 [Rubripirellula tenax]
MARSSDNFAGLSILLAKLTFFFAIAGLTGCARSVHSIDHARSAFSSGDLSAADQTLTPLAEKRGGKAVTASLDLAMVELASGDVRAAERRLRGLRDKFDGASKSSVVGNAVSMVTDDRARTYHPAGYEEVMIRTMLSLCSLAGDGTDAESYALQATTKQAALLQEAESRGVLGAGEAYQTLALAPYLRGVLREATHHDFDDAAHAYRLVSEARPQFIPAGEDIARADGGAHSQPGHGVLYVIACVGRGPVLEETTAPTTSTALSIASSVLNAETNEKDTPEGKRVDGPVLPNIASVKIPTVVIPPSPVAAIAVRTGGQLLGATQTLTDVGELATRQNEAEMPWTIARAVVRRVTKETTVAKLGDTLGLDGSAGSLFHFAAASAWAGSEKADTRCWGLLPREIQVFRSELPVGRHTVSLQSVGFGGQGIGPPSNESVDIVDGRNTYRIVVAPAERVFVASGQ